MKTLNLIKTRPITYRELQQNRLPIKTSDNIRHSHSISGTRGISRLGWRPSVRSRKTSAYWNKIAGSW